MKLSVLMTVYNEADFVEHAIRSCLPYVDHLIIVEGAYRETIKLGASSRSTDGTVEIIEEELSFSNKIWYIEANEDSDKDQRNVGLKQIKELNPDGFLLIVDGDEVYNPQTFSLIRSVMNVMRKSSKKVAYFNSLTFVNDVNHYTNQYFPRLFDLKNALRFTNDNYMVWNEHLDGDFTLYGQGSSPIKYHHYGFVKGHEKFLLKKKWWETRFPGKPFDYGWKIDENGKITDKNHKIYLYESKHPDIMASHPMMQKKEK